MSREGQIAQLVEKDLQTKLGLLFKKNFYDVAVKIARNSQYDKVGCAFRVESGKIRLIEINAQCRYLKKSTCKGTLW